MNIRGHIAFHFCLSRASVMISWNVAVLCRAVRNKPVQIRLGPSLMVGSISATAVYAEALPPPPPLVVARPPAMHHAGSEVDDAKSRLARKVEQIGVVNRQRLQVGALGSYSGRSTRRQGGGGRCLRISDEWGACFVEVQ